MKLVRPADIRRIDSYAVQTLGIPAAELMRRSGQAIADTLRAHVAPGSRIAILAGKGNNGGDGYAAALLLLADHDVTVYDIFSVGQSSTEGQQMREAYTAAGGRIVAYEPSEQLLQAVRGADAIVDAIFGTGFAGQMPPAVAALAQTVREAVGAYKLAVDVPLGVNADDGSILTESVITVSTTVELSFVKRGIVSYPGRAHVGDIVYCDLGLPTAQLVRHFEPTCDLTDAEWARAHLPRREENSHKGSFGRLLVYTGSQTYRGAAALSVGGALRGGCGAVQYAGEEGLCRELAVSYPEVIYHSFPPTGELGEDDRERLLSLSAASAAVLIGCGSSDSDALATLVCRLLASPGGPLLLDADAINALARDREAGCAAIRAAHRPVVLTPHPLEFARLSGTDVNAVQLHRMECAMQFAVEQHCTLVLKGSATVITDGERVTVNGSGSSGLAKAGSGDVLAGVMASLLAMGIAPYTAAALACYYHGMAADTLALRLSSYGITPSDLPSAIAAEIARTEQEREEECPAANGDNS